MVIFFIKTTALGVLNNAKPALTHLPNAWNVRLMIKSLIKIIIAKDVVLDTFYKIANVIQNAGME